MASKLQAIPPEVQARAQALAREVAIDVHASQSCDCNILNGRTCLFCCVRNRLASALDAERRRQRAETWHEVAKFATAERDRMADGGYTPFAIAGATCIVAALDAREESHSHPFLVCDKTSVVDETQSTKYQTSYREFAHAVILAIQPRQLWAEEYLVQRLTALIDTRMTTLREALKKILKTLQQSPDKWTHATAKAANIAEAALHGSSKTENAGWYG